MPHDEPLAFRFLGILYAAAAALVGALVVTADPGAILDAAPALALLVPAGALCWRFAFSLWPGTRVSLDAALLVPAVILLPAGAVLVAAALIAVLGCALSPWPREDAAQALWKTLANVGLLVLAVSGGLAVDRFVPLPRGDGLVDLLVRGAAVFAALQAASQILVSVSLRSRRLSVRRYLGRVLRRALPVEAATVPVAAVLVLVWLREGPAPAAVLVASVVLASAGLARLERLRQGVDRLRSELSERLAELETLGSIGRQITASVDPERVFHLVEREVCSLLEVDFFFLALLDRDTHEVDYVRVSRGGRRLARLSRPVGEGLASWVIQEGRPLRLGDAPAEARRLSLRPVILDPDVRSILAVPLLAEGRVTGVLSVQSHRREAYNEHHETLLSTAAQQAAAAIENARHFLLATVDQLTGLYHREHFERRLREEHRRHQRYGGSFAILMVDLDGFKRINDEQGHLAGDRYLRAVGEAVRASLRSADLPCRWGGEEFCILLPETDEEGATVIAERIRRGIRSLEVEHEGHVLGSSASVGVASSDDPRGRPLISLLDAADRALYEAKRRGKNRVVVA